jgi:hypothetical protein
LSGENGKKRAGGGLHAACQPSDQESVVKPTS